VISSLQECHQQTSLSSGRYDNPKEDEEMNETLTKPYRVASGEGLADVWWKSGRVTVKAGGPEPGHPFSQIEVDDPRGSGPPRHRTPDRCGHADGRGDAPVRRTRRRDPRAPALAQRPLLVSSSGTRP